MIKFAHVGFPKCASTWLQKYVFPVHKDIFFLGRTRGDKILTDELRTLFWSTFLDAREFEYDSNRTKAILDKYVQEAISESKQAIGFSSELMLHANIGRLEFGERAKRVHDFLGDSSKIIIVIREQISWIQSYYSNLVSECGLSVSFSDFMKYFLCERDISPLSCLFFDRVYQLYGSLFGEKNVKVIPMELLKVDELSFANEILDFLGLSLFSEIDRKKKNATASEKQFSAQFYLNSHSGFFLGRENAIHRPYGWHARTIYNDKPQNSFPDVYKHDIERYKQNWGIDDFINSNPILVNELPHISRVMSDEDSRLLREIYSSRNRRLEILTGLDLKALGYCTEI